MYNVQLKSKESYLHSFKVSVPASDIDKALDPGIWPLRVKVREWVYYSNKNKKRDAESNNTPNVDEAATANMQSESNSA